MSSTVRANICLGIIVKPHGLKGEVLVHTSTSKSSDLDRVESVFIKDKMSCLERKRFTPKGWLIKIQGIDKIEEAESLRGTEVYIPRSQLPSLVKNEYYLCDLKGCIGIDSKTHTAVGEFDQLEIGTAHSWWVFGKLLVPAVDHFIQSVDLKNRTIYLQNLTEL